MFRLTLLVHRYLGIAFGLIIALWCLSGFVMMYVQYPNLSEREYLAGLPVLDLDACCSMNRDVLQQLDRIDAIEIEMLAGLPVLRAHNGGHGNALVNLATGGWFSEVDEHRALQQANAFLHASGSGGDVHRVADQGPDQWTVAAYFNAYRPLYHFAADDAAGTHLYVSSVNGKVVQMTTAKERFWNWFGAVVHWIYPTVLRQDTALWARVVIWLSIASLFLVVVGIYLGVKQYGARGNGTRSPYFGLNLWHHYSGLIFGVITATWLFSGLMSMNPWGAFEGDDGRSERQRLQGRSLSSADIGTIVSKLGNVALPSATVQLKSVLLDRELAIIAADAGGQATRLEGSTLQARPLPDRIWARVAELTRPGEATMEAGIIDASDQYYFSHHEEVALPAYRMVFDDEEQTRYYFDALSGELRQKFDSNGRWNRWLFLGLHRGDFTAMLRSRPLWDLVMLPLMIGVTVGAISGVWLGYRRLVK